jgi:hypothetical protein
MVGSAFVDDFDGPGLDLGTWVPHYLPMWSSRAASAAAHSVAASALTLTVPVDHPLWCEDDHQPPLRVSGIQSGVRSGPVGSTSGQHGYRDGLVVREFQPAFWGWTPRYGRIEVRARMDLSPRSMAAAWMVGLEDEPARSAEICVFEVFGDALDGTRSAAVGAGLHPFHDPAIVDDFAAPRVPIDVGEYHVYAAAWRPGRVDFLVDGALICTVEQAPDYPMQMEIAVFDFPAHKSAASFAHHEPSLTVDHVRATPLPPPER